MDLKARLRGDAGGALVTLAGTALLTVALAPFRADVGLLNEGLLYLLLTVAIAATWGRWVGVFAAIVTNLALNFFFVQPLYRFQVEGLRNVFGLAIFLIVSVVASSLLAVARESASQARRRQAQTEILLDLSRAMIGRTDPQGALDALCTQARAAFAAAGVAVLSRGGDDWRVLGTAGAAEAARAPNPEERSMANRALSEGSIEAVGQARSGLGRPNRIVSRGPVARWRPDAVLMVPLVIGDDAIGVMRIDAPAGLAALSDERDDVLRAFASEAALTVQRLELARGAAESQALKQADEAKTALMMSISHDLKTPLAAIKTSVSSLLDNTVEWTEEDRHAFLETIESQADYLNRAISDILDLNRIESGAVRPLLRRVAVRDLLEDAVERSGPALAGRNVSLVADPALEATVDSSLVVQALANLLENAAKYSNQAGAILLTARETGDDVELAVEDEGPGIAPEDRARVFERFYRARREASRTKGTGLGLALVKGFVTLSGGDVRVESSEHGARFVLTFPRAGAIGLSA